MAEANTPTITNSEDTSTTSSTNISRQQSPTGLKQGQRQHQKVKFSNIADKEEQNNLQKSLVEASRRGDIPEIRLPESEDVADHNLPASNWAGITNAAAVLAQDRASRLHNRLSNSCTPKATTRSTYTSEHNSPSLRITQFISSDKANHDVEALKALKGDSDNIEEARRIVKTLTSGHPTAWQHQPRSGTETPAVDKHLHDLDYVPPPKEYRPSPWVLASKLAALQRDGFTHPTYRDDPGSPPLNKYSPKGIHSKSHSRRGSDIHDYSTPSSGRITPKRPKWYDRVDPDGQSTGSLGTLLAQMTATSAAAAAPRTSNYVPRPQHHRAKSSQSMIATAVDMIKHPTNYFHPKSPSSTLADEERVVLDVAEIIACRKYLKKLARSLMAVGAPSHRLEEYMKTSARALNIDGDFLYMPGSMLVSLHDRFTMSTEVTLVRESGGVDLGKFKDVFDVYKLVIHGKYTAEEGTADLDEIIQKRGRHSLALRIFAYGIAAISVGPFAFSARPVDFPPSFVLGCTLGFLQLVVVTRSEQFSHVFEVLAAVLIAFASRALGSIYHNGNPVFCFSAVAQSSIALILPGYMVLCAALELQSKSLVSGSVRMVYAIIYSLFLGFGVLVGSVVMGLIYPQAQSDVTCHIPIWWNDSNHGYKLLYVRFIWVPLFAMCLAIINQAKWNQIPVMTLIAFGGYQANFWISTKLANNIQIANAIGALAIGTMANLYSRFFHGLAAAATLPAIFVQVPR